MLSLTQHDLQQLRSLGISPEEVERQLKLFRHPPPPTLLVRPCTLGDGIGTIQEHQHHRLLEHWRSLVSSRRVVKFVPASGAATRMFRDLISLRKQGSGDGAEQSAGDTRSQEIRQLLLESLPRFAFKDALAASLAGVGLDLEELLERGAVDRLLEQLLGSKGLGYQNLPKALLPFHRYGSEARTALEEQLREACHYGCLEGGTCRVHFTVGPSFLESFAREVKTVRPRIERQHGVRLEVDFSTQSHATDTLAVDLDDRPLRASDGRLVFRPAGHGSLLKNLQDLDADVVFIKNIDNIVHQRHQAVTLLWKRLLAGQFFTLQERIFALQNRLDQVPAGPQGVEEGFRFLRDELALEPPPGLDAAPLEARHAYLRRCLTRPLRVCGVVPNQAEPGGGPFWSPDSDGGASGQIIERAQVDSSSPAQSGIWEASTHFNPVDLVCGIRDRRGRAYDLETFVDPNTAFVTRKSRGDRALKALEHPGLWNGSMSGWNTVFVEVPRETFSPVKSISDLLRPEHQP